MLGWRGPRDRHLLGEVGMLWEHFHPDLPDHQEEEDECKEELVLVLVPAGD